MTPVLCAYCGIRLASKNFWPYCSRNCRDMDNRSKP